MKELKTLKDLNGEFNEESQRLVSIDDLRAEAVKWIKAMISGKSIVCIPDSSGKIAHWVANDCLDNYTIDWIKHFFNITDAELK